MNFVKTLIAAAVLATAAPAFASTTITLDFEGTTSFASIGDYYGGGAGTNYGVVFTDAALALVNDELGPYFSNAPTPGTVMFATDNTAVMNVAAGAVDAISFHYSASSSALDVVTIYSGLDGTGSVLGNVSLSKNAQLGGCSDSPYCNWQKITLEFAGTAKSFSFGGNPTGVAFDNVTITAVPEPETYALMALGLGVIGVAARRRKA